MMLRRVEPRETARIWTGLYTVKYGARTAQFFSATLGVRFEDELTAPQIAVLKSLATKNGAPEGWEKLWTRNDAGRRMLWRWTGLGVVSAQFLGR
jgi:hypothetical protein